MSVTGKTQERIKRIYILNGQTNIQICIEIIYIYIYDFNNSTFIAVNRPAFGRLPAALGDTQRVRNRSPAHSQETEHGEEI